jgi:hypothetical protein
MNVTLREVYQTSADGERFWKMKEMFIKGNIVSRAWDEVGIWLRRGRRVMNRYCVGGDGRVLDEGHEQ